MEKIGSEKISDIFLLVYCLKVISFIYEKGNKNIKKIEIYLTFFLDMVILNCE